MDRRSLISLVGAAAVYPGHFTFAQTADRPRRVGLLILGAENPPGLALITAFRGRLEQVGWAADRIQVDIRWSGNNTRTVAADLIRTAPDIIVAQGIEGLQAVIQETRAIPTVFVQVTDPVQAGIVSSLSRPGGNITGVANFPASIAGERVRALKDIDPRVNRVLLVHDRNYATPTALLRAAEDAVKSLGLQLIGSGVSSADDLENQIRELGRVPGGGLVIFPSPFMVMHSQRVISLAAQHGLPAVYPLPNFAASGGLISLGVNAPALWQEAASTVDRILRGTSPGDVPVHVPTKVDIVVNLATAKSLGLAIPASLTTLASKVIE